MWMFLSVSGHSSEISIANHSSRPTVSQLQCVSDIVSNWFENHQPHKTKMSTVIYAPFIQSSNQMASRLIATTSFPRVFFNSCNFQGNSKLFGSLGCSDDENWLDFPAFASGFVNFAVQSCFRCKFSFHAKRQLSQVWQWRDFSQNVVRTSVTHSATLVCHFFALTTFWRHLWSITEQTHGNMESIC